MKHEFMGQMYGARDWERAFPAFGRNFWKYVVAGAKTPTEIEVMAYRSNAIGAAKSRKAGRERAVVKARRAV